METFINWNIDVVRNSFLSILLLLLLAVFLLDSSFSLFARHGRQLRSKRPGRWDERDMNLEVFIGEGQPSFYAGRLSAGGTPRGGQQLLNWRHKSLHSSNFRQQTLRHLERARSRAVSTALSDSLSYLPSLLPSDTFYRHQRCVAWSHLTGAGLSWIHCSSFPLLAC